MVLNHEHGCCYQVRKAVLDDLMMHGKKGGLGDLEKLFNVTLLNGQMGQGPDAWTPVNGGLTATNKINRKTAEKVLPCLLSPLSSKGVSFGLETSANPFPCLSLSRCGVMLPAFSSGLRAEGIHSAWSRQPLLITDEEDRRMNSWLERRDSRREKWMLGRTGSRRSLPLPQPYLDSSPIQKIVLN